MIQGTSFFACAYLVPRTGQLWLDFKPSSSIALASLQLRVAIAVVTEEQMNVARIQGAPHDGFRRFQAKHSPQLS